jgi:hypothetical protein
MKAFGDVDEIVARYESELASQDDRSHLFPIVNHRYGLVLEGVKAHIAREGNHAHLLIEVQLKSLEHKSRVGIGIWGYAYDGYPIAKLGAHLTDNVIAEVNGTCLCVLEGKNIERYLASGEYSISVAITIPKVERLIFAENAAIFQVPVFDIYGSGVPCESTRHGVIPLQIKITKVQHGEPSRN